MDYAEAGVNISLADQAKQRIRRLASRTFTRGVIGGIGSFGGLFALDKKMARAGAGLERRRRGHQTKNRRGKGIHSTVGGDLVNHCVNDILTLGAEPLFFLDYLAMGKMDPNIVEQLVEGMSRACHSAGCALIGGETAEMPGFYAPGEYDLAGFIVGVVERASLKKTNAVKPGDLVFALRPRGCTPTATRWRASLSSTTRACTRKPTSPKSATKSARSCCARTAATGRC